jgi:hypothetical protein
VAIIADNRQPTAQVAHLARRVLRDHVAAARRLKRS